jgi:hypothetical protein
MKVCVSSSSLGNFMGTHPILIVASLNNPTHPNMMNLGWPTKLILPYYFGSFDNRYIIFKNVEKYGKKMLKISIFFFFHFFFGGG